MIRSRTASHRNLEVLLSVTTEEKLSIDLKNWILSLGADPGGNENDRYQRFVSILAFQNDVYSLIVNPTSPATLVNRDVFRTRLERVIERYIVIVW